MADRDDLQSVPLLDCEELERAESALVALCEALTSFGYGRFETLPTGGRNLLVFPREPLTLYRALRGRTQMFRTSVAPALYRRLLTREAMALVPLVYYGEAVTEADLVAILGRQQVDALLARRVLVPFRGGLVSLVRVTPLLGGCIVSDRTNHRRSGEEPVWLGADSLNLVEHLQRELPGERFGSALDLCCGSGVQALAVMPYAQRVAGVDLNPRAVAMARLNARLRGSGELEFRCADLGDALSGRSYDLIVSNPPFVAMPEERREGFMDGYGGPMGLDVVDRILEHIPGSLRPNGRAYLRITSPIVRGEDLALLRLRRLAGEHGCGVRVSPLAYLFEPEFAEHQRRSGIERLVAQIVRVDHDRSGSLRIDPMPRLRAWVTRAQVVRARRAMEAR